MKRMIVAATVVLVTGILSASCVKQKDAKPTAIFYANPFSAKNDIGSAD